MPIRSDSPFQDITWPRNVTAMTAITTETRLVFRSSNVWICSLDARLSSLSMNSS